MANDQAMLSTCYCHQGLLKAAGERHIAARSWPDPLRHRRSRVTRAPVNRRGNQKTPWQFCVGHFMAWSAMEAARLVNADPLAAQYREQRRARWQRRRCWRRVGRGLGGSSAGSRHVLVLHRYDPYRGFLGYLPIIESAGTHGTRVLKATLRAIRLVRQLQLRSRSRSRSMKLGAAQRGFPPFQNLWNGCRSIGADGTRTATPATFQ